MILDHLAYRVNNRGEFSELLENTLGYWVDGDFTLDFPDGSIARSYLMRHDFNVDIFISEGDPGSVVHKWVFNNGPGLHHVAYEVRDVVQEMISWKSREIEFLSGPIYCPCDLPLVQVFTTTKPFGHIVELIERNGHPGFCEHNVKKLMDSTR